MHLKKMLAAVKVQVVAGRSAVGYRLRTEVVHGNDRSPNGILDKLTDPFHRSRLYSADKIRCDPRIPQE